ncbi:hypothetical protein FDECE_8269 [Fusarium decemcellulare]|nr:hypothetical protein FDECE_8269 [Fusarium decemcellulare]
MKEPSDDVASEKAVQAEPSTSEFIAPGPQHVTLAKNKSRWSCVDSPRLRNNLFGAVGFLELANAGDFAANVWNDTPVPIYAIVFMAIGGFSALVLSICAFADSKHAWRNITFLRQQRKLFEDEKRRRVADSEQSHDVDVLLEITIRELRIEIINRWAMDILMGGGAVLISVGTFMAIGGANRRVWLASNILSGYLGNAPIALFGLISSTWAVIIWMKMRSHKAAATEKLQGSPVLAMLQRRCFAVQVFYAINGTATILGGVGSMLTAERWWGYVILIPVIISSLFCNVWWRKRVGYDRPYIPAPPPLSTDGLIQALELTAQIRRAIQDGPGASLEQIIGGPAALEDVLAFFVKHDLFEQFCLCMVKDKRTRGILGDVGAARVELGVSKILALPELHHELILGVAEHFLRDQGQRHFLHRERFMIEVLGTHLSLERKEKFQETEK